MEMFSISRGFCLYGCMYACSADQLCLTLWLHGLKAPGSSVHGIFQARILEWVKIFSSRESFWPRGWTQVSHVSCIGRQILYHWATWEAPHGCIHLSNLVNCTLKNLCFSLYVNFTSIIKFILGGRLKREYIYIYIYIYTYDWFELFYGRSQHNIVKQLSPIKKIKKFKTRIKNCMDISNCNHKQLKMNMQKLTKLFGVIGNEGFLFLKVLFILLYFYFFEVFLVSLLNLLQYCFCFMLLFWLPGMWDLSSPTRDQVHTTCTGRWSLNFWTAREAHFLNAKIKKFCSNEKQIHFWCFKDFNVEV